MLKKLFVLFFLLFSFEQASANTTIKSLDNGFKIILQRDDTTPLVAMQLWVKHGSTSETEKEAGVAHFLEHLTFRSKDIARRIEFLGGDINAYTSFDKTVYHLTLPKRYWEEGLKVLQDILFTTTFNDKSFAEEKKVILEEMKRSYDSPQKLIYNLFFETALKSHPAKRPVIGYETTIKGVTLPEVEDFYKRFYTPANAYLVVVGDFDDQLINTASSYFGIEVTTNKNYLPQTFVEKHERTVAVKSGNVASCYLMLGMTTPDIKDPNVPAIDVLSFIYGESATSLLKERLKEQKQLVNYVYSYQMSMKDIGFFAVQANFSCEKTANVLSELANLLFNEKVSFTPEALKKSIKSYQSNYLFSRERYSDIATDLGNSYLYYADPDYSKKYISEIQKVNIADLESVKKNFLNPSKITAVMITPANYKSEAESALKNTFLTKTTDQMKQYILPNGVKLILKQKDNVPTFGFNVLSLAGSRIEDKKNAGLSSFTLSCLLRGTKNMGYKDIVAKIEALGGSISGFSTKNLSGIKGKFLSDSFYEAIEILGDIINNFSPSAEEVEKVKKFVIADIHKKKESPSRLLKDIFFSTVYPDSPLGFPIEGFEQTVANFDAKTIKTHFRKLFSPDNLVVVFSGNLPDDAYHKISSILSKLESTSQRTSSTNLVPSLNEKENSLDTEFNQTHILIGFPVPGLRSQERPYLQLLSYILSNQSGRLFTKLRDEEGLAYALGSFMFESPESSLFNLYIGTSPEKAERAKQGLLEELEKTFNNGITEEERQKAVNQIVTEIIQSLQENVDISSVYANNMLFFDDPLYYQKYQEKLLSIKTAEIIEHLKNYFKRENAVTAVIKGKGKVKDKSKP